MSTTSKHHMGYQLKSRLATLNVSQSEFAKQLGCTRQEVSRLINIPEWHVKTICRIAKAAKVPVTYFFK